MMKKLCRLIPHCLVIVIGVLCLGVFAKMILCPFTDWNFNAEGVASDFINFFWRENFHFFKLPHFNWHSDYLLYPYGVDVTFIFWAFEMNIFGALAQVCKLAPWAQCYYLLSLAITFGGVYLLFWRRKGVWWAAFFAFVLTFCNYAAIGKYPGHFTHCIVHWGVLSLLFDVILVEKVFNSEHISARFALTRILVLLLCFGLELGYIAGFACFSFFVTCVYLFGVKTILTRSPRNAARWILAELKNIAHTFGSSKWNALLLLAIILTAWVYLPTIMQIMMNTPPQEATCVWQTNPLRIFHPILPDYNPAITWIMKRGVIGIGAVDTIFAWSAGWSALLFCYFGISFGGLKGIKRWFPFMFILAAALLMRHFPIITYFPAFKYARIPERLSPYLSCLLLIPFILLIPKWWTGEWSRKAWRIVAIPVGILWLVEFLTVYFLPDTSEIGNKIIEKFSPHLKDELHAEPVCKASNAFLWLTEYKISPFAADYNNAVKIVESLPGEALFFMPFSAFGGNGDGLKKHLYLTAHQMQFAAKCGKKFNGCYLGRMFPEYYLKEFNRIPWETYLDDKVWSDQMWSVLEKFFKSADFAAFIVDVTLITPAQYDDIVLHLGRPVVSFNSYGQQYEVIPLPANLRGKKK